VSPYALLQDVEWETVIPVSVQPGENNRIIRGYDKRVPPEQNIPTDPLVTSWNILRHSQRWNDECFTTSNVNQMANKP
jgi:hypothetical protein